MIKQYRVTYDSIDQILVVHREDQEKLNMVFKMHESRLHCYNSTDKAVVLTNTVFENKQGVTRRKFYGAEKEKTLDVKLANK